MRNFKNIILAFYLAEFVSFLFPVTLVKAHGASSTSEQMVISESRGTNDYQLVKVDNPVVPAPENKENSFARFIKKMNQKAAAGFNSGYSDCGFSFFIYYISFNNLIFPVAIRSHLTLSVLLI